MVITAKAARKGYKMDISEALQDFVNGLDVEQCSNCDKRRPGSKIETGKFMCMEC